MIKELFEEKTSQFEEVLQKIASDVAGGVLHERLTPSQLRICTKSQVSQLEDMTSAIEGLMLILKPERAYTIKLKCRNLEQTLSTYNEILVQNTTDPPTNSCLALEQLKKALTEGSSLLSLVREVKTEPSPVMEAIMALKQASDRKVTLVSIKSSQEIQPLLKYVFGRIENIKTSVNGLEKKTEEIKRSVQELQEEGLRILSRTQRKEVKEPENKREKKQLPLSNFEGEHN